ncbi:MAG: CoA transferase, partial [Pseudomonadota bacterium]
MTGAAFDVLSALGDAVGWAPEADRLTLRDGPAAIATSLPVSDVAAGAYGALALAAAELAARRGGALTPWADRRHAGLALAGNEYLRVGGAAPETWGSITGYHRCGDGGWVYLHGNFPHQRDGLLRVFGAANDRAAMAAALAKWDAAAAEEAAQAEGFLCIRWRSRAEWEADPQRAALAAAPVVDFMPRPSGAAAPLRAPAGRAALSGLRVLDLSRI